MISKKIYLASPYSAINPAIREARHLSVCRKAGELMRAGYIVFSPIAHSHPIAEVCELPKDWEFWKKYDKTFIDWCDELWILMLPGWKTSKGVSAEVELAMALGKFIKHIPRG
ncbi:MAG: hypothetical protein DRP97_04255 [Candidatus Latescibacterota bacterium]|nr:MAG: hypothetical protein DRP97_04255 [Candidatus Latescibacterota bacterium]